MYRYILGGVCAVNGRMRHSNVRITGPVIQNSFIIPVNKQTNKQKKKQTNKKTGRIYACYVKIVCTKLA